MHRAKGEAAPGRLRRRCTGLRGAAPGTEEEERYCINGNILQ